MRLSLQRHPAAFGQAQRFAGLLVFSTVLEISRKRLRVAWRRRPSTDSGFRRPTGPTALARRTLIDPFGSSAAAGPLAVLFKGLCRVRPAVLSGAVTRMAWAQGPFSPVNRKYRTTQPPGQPARSRKVLVEP